MGISRILCPRWLIVLAFAGATVAVPLALASEPFQSEPPEARGVLLDPLNKPETYRKLPAHKQAFLDRENELRRRALDNPLSDGIPASASTDYRVTPRAAEPGPAHREAGVGVLIEGGCGMLYRGSEIDFTNKWIAKGSERSVEVCSGEKAGQGGVQVTF